MRNLSSATTSLLLFTSALALAGCAEGYMPRAAGRLTVMRDGTEERLVKDGRKMPLGDLDEAVRDNPHAEAEAQAFSSSQTAGTVFAILGAVSVGAGAALVVDDGVQSGNHNDRNFPSGMGGAGLGLMFGGLALDIASAVFQSNARTHFLNAVNIYNDEATPRGPFVPYATPYGAPVPAPGYRPLPSFQGPNPGYGPPSYAPPNGPTPPPGFAPSPPPGAPGGALGPVPSLPPGALPPAGSQPQPLNQ